MNSIESIKKYITRFGWFMIQHKQTILQHNVPSLFDGKGQICFNFFLLCLIWLRFRLVLFDSGESKRRGGWKSIVFVVIYCYKSTLTGLRTPPELLLAALLALVMAAAAAAAAGAVPTVAGDDVTAPMVDWLLVGDDPLVMGAPDPVPVPGAAIVDRVESNPTPFVLRLTVTLMAPIVVNPTASIHSARIFLRTFLFLPQSNCFLEVFLIVFSVEIRWNPEPRGKLLVGKFWLVNGWYVTGCVVWVGSRRSHKNQEKKNTKRIKWKTKWVIRTIQTMNDSQSTTTKYKTRTRI